MPARRDRQVLRDAARIAVAAPCITASRQRTIHPRRQLAKGAVVIVSITEKRRRW